MKYIKILLLSIIPVLYSCSEDFLDTKQTGVQSEDIFFESLDNIKLSVDGTYAALNSLPGSLTNLDMMYLGFGSIASDEAEAGGEQGGRDFIDFQDIDKGSVQPSESKAMSDNFWGYNYKGILRANSTLDGIKLFKSANSGLSAENLALVNRFEGEMHFIRAFIHFRMMQVYGGVPIVDHVLGSTEYNVKRDTISKILHFVEKELQLASNMLPLQSQYAATEFGRASKGAAQALLAKAYLYEASYAENYPGDARFGNCNNTYSKALIYADSVINSNEYTLVGINGETFDTYWNQNGSPLYPATTPGYRYIFTVDGENSKESIFSIQSINDNLDYMFSRGTYLTIYTTVRNYKIGTSVSTLGWGFNCPTDSLLHQYDPADPRKSVTIGQTGDPIYIAGAWNTLDCHQSPTNMIGRKYEASPAQYWDTRSSDGNGPTNFPYIRYGDVVLMAAEAAFKTGDNAKALTYVNMIRKRARNGAATGVPADLSSVTLASIQNERLLELALEGHRFFDLVRWKMQNILVGKELQKYLGGNPQTPILSEFTVGKNDFEPIPMAEVINSNRNLQQYPGW